MGVDDRKQIVVLVSEFSLYPTCNGMMGKKAYDTRGADVCCLCRLRKTCFNSPFFATKKMAHLYQSRSLPPTTLFLLSFSIIYTTEEGHYYSNV